MTGRRRLGLVAAGSTLLAAAPLSTIFDTWTWLVKCILAVAMIAGAAQLARARRAPLWAQALSMAAALLLGLTWMFPSGEELVSILPTPDTFAHFAALLAEAGLDTQAYAVPVPDRPGLLFIAVLGVGSVAIVVDLLAAGLRRTALAGLPMLAIYAVPVAIYVDSVPVFTFAVAAAGYLWLLVADNVDRVRRFGRRYTGDGRNVDIWEASPLAAAGGRLAVLGVAAAVLVPLAVPGLTTSVLSDLTQAGSGAGGTGSGTNGRVNLFANLSGNLTQPKIEEWAQVTTNEPTPHYLRFGVADVLTDRGFSARPPSGQAVTRGLPDPPSANGASYQSYHAVVQVTENFQMPFAPIFPTTTATSQLDSSWSYDPSMEVIFSKRSTVKNRRYEFDYVRATYDPQVLRAAPSLGANDPLRTQFTAVPRDQVVIDTVADLIDDKGTDYDKVLAIHSSFSQRNGFTYSLQASQQGTAGSDVATFLLNKVGFCQQYAAAMAWMVREAGIPARVAFGFTRGNSRNGDAYVLTNRNLHAWTEVYFDGFGWIPFDATPAAAVAGSTRSIYEPDPDQVRASATASAGSSAAPAASASAAPVGPNPAGRADLDRGAPGAGDGTSGAGVSTGALVGVALGALLLSLLSVPALRRTLLRRRRRDTGGGPAISIAESGRPEPGTPEPVAPGEQDRAREDAHAAWDELVDTMIDFRVFVDPTETPRHTARRLAEATHMTGPALEAATLLGRAEEQARYARRPLPGGELTAALGQVRRALSAAANRRTRLRAFTFPPSVLLRWRLSVADASERWVSAYGRRRDAASRWSPRRLLANRASRRRGPAGPTT